MKTILAILLGLFCPIIWGQSGVTSINGQAGAFTFSGGGVSCAGTTCTFNGGASTPATTNLYKGNGSANGVIAATPGTDYISPSLASLQTMTGSLALPGLSATASISVGATPTAACGAATGCLAFTEGSMAGTPTVNNCYIRADSTTDKFWVSCNHAAEAPIVTAVAPQITILTEGTSGTYTTPTGALYLRVIAQACGGGGGGSGTGAGNGGNCASTNTTFGSSIVAGYGQGGVPFYGQGAPGGSAAGGTDNRAGNAGTATIPTLTTQNGGTGGGGCSNGGGAGGLAQGNTSQATGQDGQSPGAGGGGAAANGTANAGPGGGAGGCVHALIVNPAASYAYTVGPAAPGGSAGTGGAPGGGGAAGQIIVEAYY